MKFFLGGTVTLDRVFASFHHQPVIETYDPYLLIPHCDRRIGKSPKAIPPVFGCR
jgi:hypothetical protein